MKNIFSTNDRVNGFQNFKFVIAPDKSLAEQIRQQVVGLNPGKEDIVVLHPIPTVGSATCAFLRGKHNNFPTIALVGPDGVNHGSIDLQDFRHNVARPERGTFLSADDNVAENATIIVNSSGREIPSHQIEELKKLAGTDNLVVATLQLGQIDLGRQDLPEWLLGQLVEALKGAGIGRSIASRQVIAVTAGLSPVNAILMVALNALCESWGYQPVAERHADGSFHFTDLVNLEEVQSLGRKAAAGETYVVMPRVLFNQLLEAHAPGTELGDALRALIPAEAVMA